MLHHPVLTRVLSSGLTALLLSACTQTGPAPETASRLQGAVMQLQHDPVEQAALAGELVAMQDSAARLARLARRGDAATADTLEMARTRYQRLSHALPRHLAMQAAQKAALTERLAEGAITLPEHNHKLETLRQERRDLAAALTLSARDVRRAERALRSAEAKDGVELAPQIRQAGLLAEAMAADRAALSPL